MVHNGQIDRVWEQGPVAIRALRSLTAQAFDTLSDAIRDLPGRWTLERHDDYDGYLSVLISPEGDSNAPMYLISGKVGQVELAQFEGEELHTLARSYNVEATAAELVKALKRLRGQTKHTVLGSSWACSGEARCPASPSPPGIVAWRD